ncbi:histone deacetylase complex protein [Russula earlei]|uniref:Histone deacetylase complex protein n=1 Tax=Russula earlei TaxID=71964 RepID=A0ACC0TUF5_9AGAM|nr:histone deacetylase complex protein [Russula earlei]
MDVDRIVDGPIARSSPSLRPGSLDSRLSSAEAGSLPRASSVPLAPSTYTVGYVYDAAMMSHIPDEGDEHPEQPQRIVAVHNTLLKHGCLSAMKRLPFRRVQREAVLLVHTEQHWRMVLALKSLTRQEIVDSKAFYEHDSLYVSPQTTDSALLSCGGVIESALAVARGDLKKTLAIVRPPGHHAEPDRPMGFCFFNNVAVAARVVQQLTAIKRILILDCRCLGNGTQRAFNDDPSVLYISLHRYEGGRFYPCGPFGGMTSCGEGRGLGYSVNIPWAESGTTDADYIHAFQQIVMPIATEFAPELVIISAGFDAADGDMLGECCVTPAGYAHMTYMLSTLAGGRLVAALEGGYTLESLSNCALAVGRMLLGEAPPELPPLVASEVESETVWLVAKEQSKYWKNINTKSCEPKEDVEEFAFAVPELLKAHRQDFMYRNFDMLEVPLMHDDVREKFSAQIMCSKDLLDNEVLVVFAHEFGNLRVEISDRLTCDIQLESSYIIDVSRQLVNWVQQEHYGLLDINLFPKPPSSDNDYPRKSPEQYAREIMTYLWDNYILLSTAKRIILIGHGPGVVGLSELLEARTAGVMRNVNLVVQVVGYTKIPLAPKKGPDLSTWYQKHSLVIVPHDHVIRHERKILKRHGRLVFAEEPKPVKLMLRALPLIQAHVRDILAPTMVPE